MSVCAVCGKKLNIFNRGSDLRCLECLKGLTDLEAQKRINKDPAYKYIPKSRDALPVHCDVSRENNAARSPNTTDKAGHTEKAVGKILNGKNPRCSKDKPNPLSKEQTPFAYDLIEAYRKEFSTDPKEFTLEAVVMLTPDIVVAFAERWIDDARDGDEDAQKALAVTALLVPTFLRGAAEIKTPMPVSELRNFHMRVLRESLGIAGIRDPDVLLNLYKFAVGYTRKLFATKTEAAVAFRKKFLVILRDQIRHLAEGKAYRDSEFSGSIDLTYKHLGDLLNIESGL